MTMATMTRKDTKIYQNCPHKSCNLFRRWQQHTDHRGPAASDGVPVRHRSQHPDYRYVVHQHGGLLADVATPSEMAPYS
jgi:hypothetical protein